MKDVATQEVTICAAIAKHSGEYEVDYHLHKLMGSCEAIEHHARLQDGRNALAPYADQISEMNRQAMAFVIAAAGKFKEVNLMAKRAEELASARLANLPAQEEPKYENSL